MWRSRTLGASLIAASFALAQDPLIRVPVRVVTVPTAVIAQDGQFVRGIPPFEFRLFDNEREQNVHVEYVDERLSLAVVVQTSDAVRAWLPAVRRVASTVEALVVGEGGEASVNIFGDDVRSLQALTSSTPLLDKAFKAIVPGGRKSRCLDAVLAAAKELEKAEPDRRRVILLIAQAGDQGSTAELRQVLNELQVNNIGLYSLVMPRVGKDLVHETISIRDTRSGLGRNDTGIMASVDLGKLIPEIFRGSKAAAGEDAVTVLTASMGGRQIPFRKLRDLEAGISAIGEELHTEYLLTYTPDRLEPGYHRIHVTVQRGGGLTIRSRPGYYVTQ